MKHEVGWFTEPAVGSPSAAPSGPGDARTNTLELLARNLADLREAVANLGDEPLAALVHGAWQRAASLLLKLPPADGPAGREFRMAPRAGLEPTTER